MKKATFDVTALLGQKCVMKNNKVFSVVDGRFYYDWLKNDETEINGIVVNGGLPSLQLVCSKGDLIHVPIEDVAKEVHFKSDSLRSVFFNAR